MRNVARVVEYRPANFGETTSIRFRFMGHRHIYIAPYIPKEGYRGAGDVSVRWPGEIELELVS